MAHRSVFISYSRLDGEVARQIVTQLEAHGIECWYDKRDVPGGTDWPAEIVRAIGEARVIVLIFSASANSSPQVRREVILAMERGVRVVPFRIEDVAPSQSLEYFLGGQQWIDAFPAPLEPHCTRLIACLDNILPRTQIDRPTIEASNPEPAPPHFPDAAVVKPATPPVVPQPQARRPLAIESAKLRRLEGELANYIGPIAKWKVDCAVSEVDDPGALCATLSGEIETEKDRTKFLASCHQLLV
jgi:hypothetical protein